METAQIIKGLILARESALAHTIFDISKEEERDLTCQNVIEDLETAISKGKKVLQIYEDHLATLLSLRGSLSDLGDIHCMDLKQTSSLSGPLYSELIKYTAAPVYETREEFDQQIETIQKRVRNLWEKVKKLELELKCWNYSRSLSAKAIQNLNINKEAIEGELREAKELFRPIRRMPYEVWATIFALVVKETTSYQSSIDRNLSLRLPFLSISQVCKLWRRIVYSEPSLSNMAYITPSQVWTHGECNLIADIAKRNKSPLIILTDLYDNFRCADD